MQKVICVLASLILVGCTTSTSLEKPASGEQEPDSPQFGIYGSVHIPGEYPLRKGTTVLQAIAGARGYTFGGETALIVRDGKVIEINIKDLEKDPSTDTAILDGDVIIMPRRYK